VIEQKPELKALEKLVVPPGAERMPPPEVAPGQRLDWADTLKIVDRLDRLLADGSAPVLVRLLVALRFIELLGQARFEKIRGPRLSDFIEIIAEAARSEAPDDLKTVPAPGGTGRMQFRLLAAQYARKDTFAETGWQNRWRLFRAALRFTRGQGLVPPLQDRFSAVPFADLERPYGPLSPEIDEMLTRYLRVKVAGLHFCGAAYYGVPLVEGFQSLALAVAAVLWIARWLAASSARPAISFDDVAEALAIADHHHGYSPAFGQAGFRGRVRLLARLDEIARLVAWYGRTD
jgi:lysine-N-methylase